MCAMILLYFSPSVLTETLLWFYSTLNNRITCSSLQYLSWAVTTLFILAFWFYPGLLLLKRSYLIAIAFGFPLTCTVSCTTLLPDVYHAVSPSCLRIQNLREAITDPCTVVYCLLQRDGSVWLN